MSEGYNHQVIVVDANRRVLLTSPSFLEYEQARTFAITLQECTWHEVRPVEIIVQTRDPASTGDPVDASEDHLDVKNGRRGGTHPQPGAAAPPPLTVAGATG